MSPTGYPIKYLPLEGTTADPEIYAARTRICNRGYLLQSHLEEQADGTTKETYICPAMPPEQYARLGGDAGETEGRVCLCNGLLSTAGYYDDIEAPVVTMGVSGKNIHRRETAREIVEEILTPAYVAQREKELQTGSFRVLETVT